MVFQIFFRYAALWATFQSSPLTWLWEGFLLCGNFSSSTTPSPGSISIHKYFVSVFVFYILSYLLLKRLGWFSGCLVSSTSVQKLFCGSCSTFKWSFDEFVGGESGLPVLSLHQPGSALISIFLNLPRLAFCPSMWSILQNVPCAFERICSPAFEWNAL